MRLAQTVGGPFYFSVHERHGGGNRPGGRGGDRIVVALARVGLQDVPAALPLPRDRPPTRSAVPRRRAWHRRPRRSRAALRPAVRRAHAVRRDRPGRAGLAAPARRGTRARHTVRRRRRGRGAVRLARLRARPRRELLRPGGSDGARTRGPGGTRRGGRRRAAAARICRPTRHLARGRHARRRLQDGHDPARGVRSQGAVPDEVLRARAVAYPRRRAAAAEADLPRRPRHVDLLAGRRRARPVRTHAQGNLDRHRPGDREGRLPPEPEQAVRLVRQPGPLPVLRWHSPAVPARRVGGPQSRSARSHAGRGRAGAVVRAHCPLWTMSGIAVSSTVIAPWYAMSLPTRLSSCFVASRTYRSWQTATT